MIKNIDLQLLAGTENRFMLLKQAYESQNACRTILVPRYPQSMVFDGETAHFAITGGNDKKIRYWNLDYPEQQSYKINTPRDDESILLSESVEKKN